MRLCLFSLCYLFQAKLDAQSKLKQAQADIDNLQESLEEEQESKSDVMKQLSAAKGEVTQWKSKFDSEINPKMEELEENKYVLLL